MEPPNEKQHVKLLPNQIPHVLRMRDILANNLAVIDTSDMGKGKTFTTCSLIQQYYPNYAAFLFVPKEVSISQINGWSDCFANFGISYYEMMTYKTLVGIEGKVSHGYLRADKDDIKNYRATSKFGNACKEGLVLILDEAHAATRPLSRTHWAVAALIRTCKKYYNSVKVIMLSGTLGDKVEHIQCTFRMLGLITAPQLMVFDRTNKEYLWKSYGLGELKKNLITLLGEDETNQLWERPIKKGSDKIICERVYEQVIKRYYRSNIDSVPEHEQEYKNYAYNLFLDMDDEDVELLDEGIAILSRSVRYQDNNVGNGDWNMGGVIRGLQMIEEAKLPMIARFVHQQMDHYRQRKFIICCGARDINNHKVLADMLTYKCMSFEKYKMLWKAWKTSPMFRLMDRNIFRRIMWEALDDVKPTILNGETSEQQRCKILRRFNEDNNDIRILIMSPGVGSESISLHDLHGGRERIMLNIPDHFHTKAAQQKGRINRAGQQSDSYTYMVYSKQGAIESSVISCMIRKSKVARIFIGDDQDALYPGEYGCLVEGEMNNQLQQIVSDINMYKKTDY